MSENGFSQLAAYYGIWRLRILSKSMLLPSVDEEQRKIHSDVIKLDAVGCVQDDVESFPLPVKVDNVNYAIPGRS
ncbi:hypothetical protein TNCV_995431 [Trichonephila clavipes]|nr:hypothetical protein TNCV_995431 [Trichonephila clavipes]